MFRRVERVGVGEARKYLSMMKVSEEHAKNTSKSTWA